MSDRYDFFREMSSWQLEAKEEDNVRYFYPLPEITELESGTKCYVIGRKGSGKTAIAQHLRENRNYKTFIRNLSFKNFPFNELYKLEDGKFTTPSQYTTIWKYIIYGAICSMMAENESIDRKISGPLGSYFGIDFDRALASNLSKLGELSFGLNIMGSGAEFGKTSSHTQNFTPWPERVDILEKIIDKYIDGSRYFILFDEIDEDYEDILNIDRKSKYFELLIGLFKATYDIRGKFRRPHSIRPIVFLRDDIYDIIQNNDKNKWDDLAVILKWTEDMLRNLIAFRISRAINMAGELLSFDDALSQTFESETIRYGKNTRSKRPIFRHILARTLMRPRDVVSYFRECAGISYRRQQDLITTDVVKEAEEPYSLRFRQELIDEIQSIMPSVPQILDALAALRKPIFSFPEFGEFYASVKKEISTTLEFEEVCKVLFHFSAIGNQPAQHNYQIFKYLHPNAKINVREYGMIHPGLRKSLQIK